MDYFARVSETRLRYVTQVGRGHFVTETIVSRGDSSTN